MTERTSALLIVISGVVLIAIFLVLTADTAR